MNTLMIEIVAMSKVTALLLRMRALRFSKSINSRCLAKNTSTTPTTSWRMSEMQTKKSTMVLITPRPWLVPVKFSSCLSWVKLVAIRARLKKPVATVFFVAYELNMSTSPFKSIPCRFRKRSWSTRMRLSKSSSGSSFELTPLYIIDDDFFIFKTKTNKKRGEI